MKVTKTPILGRRNKQLSDSQYGRPCISNLETHFDIMWMWQLRAPVYQDLEYLVVVLVGGELEGGDVRGIGGGHGVQRLQNRLCVLYTCTLCL